MEFHTKTNYCNAFKVIEINWVSQVTANFRRIAFMKILKKKLQEERQIYVFDTIYKIIQLKIQMTNIHHSKSVATAAINIQKTVQLLQEDCTIPFISDIEKILQET
jgi:hypothetical protein